MIQVVCSIAWVRCASGNALIFSQMAHVWHEQLRFLLALPSKFSLSCWVTVLSQMVLLLGFTIQFHFALTIERKWSALSINRYLWQPTVSWTPSFMRSRYKYTLGCIEFFLYLIFIRLTLFSLYFLILRTIYFLTFFDLRPPSFANFNFCLLMGIRRNFNGKIIRFLIPCRNMVYIWSIWF